MRIERISPTHPRELFQQIARLHVQEIHHGLLPMLGQPFVARMYYEMSRAPRTGVWAALEDEEVLGFVAGCADVGRTHRVMLLRRGPVLALLALRALLRPTVLRRLPAMLLYPLRASAGADEEPEAPHAELLAIAVDRRSHRLGLGHRLVEVFEQALREWDVRGAYQVLTNTEEIASNRFYRKLGLEPHGTVRHHDLLLQRYTKQLTPSR